MSTADQEYGRFRGALLARIMGEGLTPMQVAAELGEAANRFKQITYEECRLLRSMGDSWGGRAQVQPEIPAAVETDHSHDNELPLGEDGEP